MRNSVRLLTALFVAFALVGPLAEATALTEPRPLLAGPALESPPPGSHTTGNPGDADTSRLIYEPLGIPTFRWQDTGASKYELEIATSEAFGDSVVLRRSGLQYPMYTPTGSDETGSGLSLAEDPGANAFTDSAQFYWHVRAYDDANKQWGDFSETYEFVRHWGYRPAGLHEGPAEYQPGEGVASVQPLMPYFEWEPVPGASFYQIQVDTSDSFGSPSINAATDVPRYTPTASLPNDDDLFWRVRAFHRPATSKFTGGRGGEWSDVRQFKLAWSSQTQHGDRRPILLTPPNGANYANRPLFCWQPVEGAKSYRIDVAKTNGFVSGSFVVSNHSSEGTCYSFPRDGSYALTADTEYWWRVRAVDAEGYPGQRTDEGVTSAPFQFRTAPDGSPGLPDLFYPPYYYDPIRDEAFEDRTIAVPTFIWGHVDGASHYELCVDDAPYMDCTSPDALVVTTANASYTFTDTTIFEPVAGQDYYWKVRSDISPPWEELNTRWLTRIDTGRLDSDNTVAPLLPTYGVQAWTSGGRYGGESATYYPVFSWRASAPTGQAVYAIQIARDAAFSDIVHEAETGYSEYTPVGRPEPGTYFWRVRQVAPVDGSWTIASRFVISRYFAYGAPDIAASRAEWESASLGLYQPSGEIGDAAGEHDLVEFHIAAAGTHWFLGVPATISTTVGLYLDTDHIDERGATSPPTGRSGPAVPDAHRPEYAIYWKAGDTGDLGKGEVWKWLGSSWQKLGILANILSEYSYDTDGQFLKLKLSSSQIDQPGALSLLLFTINSQGEVADLLPNVPGNAGAATFLTESTTPTPILPANSLGAGEDVDYWSLTQRERNTPVLQWRHNGTLHDDGLISTLFFQTYRDDTFTTLYESENGKSPNYSTSSYWRFWDANTHWAPQVHYSDNNSYNWRISRGGFGPSAPHHFAKLGYVPMDLQVLPIVSMNGITGTHITPSFTWQPAQSAARYLWELFEGGTRTAYADTMLPYYTPRGALKDGTYTWKVWAKDARGRLTNEASQGVFTKMSYRVDPESVWDEISDSELLLGWAPVEGAAYYKVTIASDSNLSRNVNTYTTHGTTFTPEVVPKAALSGPVWWRVIVCDNKGNEGQWMMEPRFLPEDPPVGVVNLPLVVAP